MNIQEVRESINNFLVTRVRVDVLDLDYPDQVYSNVNNQILPANTLINLPIEELSHTKVNYNSVKTKVKFPYKLTYRFPSEMPYHDLPMKALEGMAEYICILFYLQQVSLDIESIIPTEIVDPIVVEKVEELSGDWLVHLNFSVTTIFTTKRLPDISDLQGEDYYEFDNPPTLQEINIRVNRAKSNFNRLDNSTYIQDSELTIN